jgi:hypothetical protein
MGDWTASYLPRGAPVDEPKYSQDRWLYAFSPNATKPAIDLGQTRDRETNGVPFGEEGFHRDR